ncbi:MAG: sensor histidine kinase, partial [Candidatus Zixiibacteriota bacterium]
HRLRGILRGCGLSRIRGQARADLATHIAASLRTPFSEALNTTSRALTAHAELINLCEQRCDCLAEDGSKSFEGVSEEEKRLRSRLAEEAGRIEEFLEDLERLSRPGEERKLANIADLTRMAVRVCERDYRDVALVSERSESSLPKALCYTDELVEVFVILINNATDSIRETLERAGGRRGAIEVIVESLHEFIQVRIVDNGRGIPEEFQDKVFERLFTTKDVVEGFGHGLYLAKEIIERRHGGSIGFTSIVGAGTTFTVKIPQAPGAA